MTSFNTQTQETKNMNSYQVKVHEVHSTIVDVVAENEEDAKIQAQLKLCSDNLQLEYSYTMAPEEWKVWEA